MKNAKASPTPHSVNVVCPKCGAPTMTLLYKKGLLGIKSVYQCAKCTFSGSADMFKKLWFSN